MKTAQDKLKDTLASLPGKPQIPSGFDPLSSSFNAQKGDPGDDLLESYGTALDASGLSHTEAAEQVAQDDTQLTQNAQAAITFTTPKLTTFRAGTAQVGSKTILSLPDPNRGPLTADLTFDSQGNISRIDSKATDPDLKLVKGQSWLGNKVAMLCTEGAGAFGTSVRSQYVYLSEDWEPVTNLSELDDKKFNDYEDCWDTRTGTVEFDSVNDTFQYFGELDHTDPPTPGFSKAFSEDGLVEEGKENQLAFARAFKLTLNGKTTYAVVGVTSELGSDKPTIDGDKNYVTLSLYHPDGN